MGVDTTTRTATMVETPIAGWAMNGTVADKGTAFRQLADELPDASYGRASAIDPRHGLRRRAAPLDEESQLAGA